MKAAGYPRDKSPEKLPGRRKIEIDLDRWVEAGNVRFAWVIGTTWTAAMAASQELAQRFRDMTVNNSHQITSNDQQEIVDTLIKRVESGGMVVVNSEIYPVEPIGTEFADIVLPAAAWGAYVELTSRICPLTVWENDLRRLAGEGGFSESFVERYLLPVIYPAGLTQDIQLTLAAFVVIVNLAVYAWVLNRVRIPQA